MLRLILFIFGTFLITFTGLNLWMTQGPSRQESTQAAITESPQADEDFAVNTGDYADISPAAGAGAPEASSQGVPIGGAFTLIDQNGQPVKDTDFRGKLMLVFFGFTHCPDICPVSLATMTNVLNTLGEKASQVAPIFITVDPERDTPEVMKEYVKSFHPSLTALTGSREAVDAAADAYRVYHARREEPAPAGEHAGHGEHSEHAAHGMSAAASYRVDHSGFIYLIDREGNYLAHFTGQDPEERIVKVIQESLK